MPLVTHSLVYYIKTKDFYADLLKIPGLLECTDMVNLPRDLPCNVAESKKIPGLFPMNRMEKRSQSFVHYVPNLMLIRLMVKKRSKRKASGVMWSKTTWRLTITRSACLGKTTWMCIERMFPFARSTIN
ncbi:Hypothetical protein CINCED_3A019955 [Cinara cedri]|uniref:Uncharacterized protein n=1 Tax=Cinara cedri TaxID=506608 RepID=A0A5E4NEI6_9HEMI|nr:Hypothetical protein CINCED_3A019955 [Cinara cedri]